MSPVYKLSCTGLRVNVQNVTLTVAETESLGTVSIAPGDVHHKHIRLDLSGVINFGGQIISKHLDNVTFR